MPKLYRCFTHLALGYNDALPPVAAFILPENRRLSMQFQFSTRSLLLVTAVVAIICAGLTAWARIFATDLPFLASVLYIGITIPLWMPIVFLAFVTGRRKLSVGFVLAFALAKAAAVGLCYLVSQMRW